MLYFAVDFYKTLFVPEPRLHISVGEEFSSENEKVSQEANFMLEAPFMEEIRSEQFLVLMLRELPDLKVFLSSSTRIFGRL